MSTFSGTINAVSANGQVYWSTSDSVQLSTLATDEPDAFRSEWDKMPCRQTPEYAALVMSLYRALPQDDWANPDEVDLNIATQWVISYNDDRTRTPEEIVAWFERAKQVKL